MRYIVLTIIFFISAIVQANIANNFVIYGVRPNLFIALITGFALLGGRVNGAIAGFIAGFIEDIIIGNFIGGYALLGMYLGLIAGALNARFVKDNLLVAICFVFVSSFIYESVIYFFTIFFWGQTDIIYAVKRIIFPEAVYNAGITILLFPIVMLIEDRMDKHARLSRKY